LGCSCKKKYKANNLDDERIVKEALSTYKKYVIEENSFDEYWDELYVAFISVYPNSKVHTKAYVKEQLDILWEYRNRI
jgi:hypothetical protein